MQKFLKNSVVKYLIVGWITTAIDIIIFLVLCKFTFLGNSVIGITFSNAISIIVSIVLAYFANKLYVYQLPFNTFTAEILGLLQFLLSRLFTTIIEVGGVFIALNVFHQSKLVGKIEIQFVVVFINYFLGKLIFLRNKKS